MLPEAAGNSLQAIGKAGYPEKNVNVFGSWLQTAGNSANAASRVFLLDGQKKDGHYLDVIGNVIQTLGASAEAIGTAAQKKLAYREQHAAGYLLIASGSAVDGVSGIYFLKEHPAEGRTLGWFGAYLQAVGALLAADAIHQKGHDNDYRILHEKIEEPSSEASLFVSSLKISC